MKPNLDELAKRYASTHNESYTNTQLIEADFKSGYTRAIADVVEWLEEIEAECVCNCEESCKYCNAETIAMQIENKFLKGEKND